MVPLAQISCHLLPDDPLSPRVSRSMVCSTTTARPQAVDTIRSTCSTRTVMAARGAVATVVAKLGCISMMRRCERYGTRMFSEDTTMIEQRNDVLICSFIVALLPHGQDDLFTFTFVF